VNFGPFRDPLNPPAATVEGLRVFYNDLITSGLPGFNSPFPAELGVFLSVAILVTVALVLGSGRGPDADHTTVVARYLGAVIVITFFVMLFAAFSSAFALTDLVVNHTDRSAEYRREQNREDISIGGPSVALPVADTQYDFSAERNNDANYSAAAASGFVAIGAALIWLLHRRWQRRLPATAGVDSVDRVARLGICFVTALTIAVAFTSVAFGIFEIIAPGVAIGGKTHVGRAEGVSEAISFGLLGIAALGAFVTSWRRVRPRWAEPPEPDAAPSAVELGTT
jgi:hypothetical protein